MQINTNYNINRPSFGKLTQVITRGGFQSNPTKKSLDVIKTFKESKAFSKICEEFDVTATFWSKKSHTECDLEFPGKYYKFNAEAGLLLSIKDKERLNTSPIEICIKDKHDHYEDDALENLAKRIKSIKYSEIKDKYVKLTPEYKMQQEQEQEKVKKSFKDKMNELIESMLNN